MICGRHWRNRTGRRQPVSVWSFWTCAFSWATCTVELLRDALKALSSWACDKNVGSPWCRAVVATDQCHTWWFVWLLCGHTFRTNSRLEYSILILEKLDQMFLCSYLYWIATAFPCRFVWVPCGLIRQRSRKYWNSPEERPRKNPSHSFRRNFQLQLGRLVVWKPNADGYQPVLWEYQGHAKKYFESVF